MSVLLLAGAPVQALAQTPRPAANLAGATLEDLMNVVITTPRVPRKDWPGYPHACKW